MRKLFSILSILVLLTSCDDGDITLESFNFEGQTILDCDANDLLEENLLFKTKNDELLLLIDKKNNLEIAVRELSTKTNFNSLEVKTDQELLLFCKLVKFPSHGLIVRKLKDDFSHLILSTPELHKTKGHGSTGKCTTI